MNSPGRRLTHVHRRLEVLVAVLVAAGLAAILVEADSAPAAPGGAAPAAADASGTPDSTSEPESTPAPGGGGTAQGEQEATQAGGPQPLVQGAQRRKPNTRPRIEQAGASPRKVFLGGPRRAKFRFEWDGLRTRKLLVKVVKVSTGNVRKRIRLGKVDPGERKRVAWNGRIGGRKPGWLSRGAHAFRVFANGERAKVRKRNSSNQRFRFYRHRFPVQGRHTYGDGLGAGRGHQGQDLFGRCGSKIRAARGGRVQTRAYQSAAGYYVVIDGRGTREDYVYMHLRRKQRPKVGSWVKTGQVIGRMGATGNASGCHLHFELWTGPGWYEGGHPRSPTRALRRWDGWS